MRINRYFGILVAVAGLCACSKLEHGPENGIATNQNGGEFNFALNASADAVSKTALDGEDFITWSHGDAISIWEAGNQSNANVKLTLDSASEGERQGVFKGTFTPEGTDFTLCAIYPYKDTYGDNPTEVALSVPVSVSQCSDINGVIGHSDFLLGKSSFKSSDENYAMSFFHPLTILDIQIDGSNSVLKEATIASLTITAETAFVGDVSANLVTGEVTSVGEGGKSLVINFPETAKMSMLQHAYVAILPADLTAAKCCFDLKMSNGQEIRFNVNPKKAFEAQHIYPVIISDIDAKVEAGKASPIYFDLVAANTSAGLPGSNRANCYIITEPGYYKFAAQRVDKTNCFEGEKPASGGYEAKWLWSSGPNSIVNYVSLGNSGAINFRATGMKGNAVIALLNPDGQIVWSWHIWYADKDIMKPHSWSRGNTWLVSDINLGATSKEDNDPEAYGLYYQWGRKDPFPANASACVFNTGVEMKGYSSKSADVTAGAVAYSIAHPTIFLNANDYRTWISSSDDAVNAQSLWNNTNTKINKTNYDPCPAGYCVPVNNSYSWGSNFVAGNMTWGTTGFIYSKDGCGNTFYPCGGYLNGFTLTDAGETARCWAANLSATPNATTHMLGYSLLGTKSTHAIKVNEGSRCAFALNVRCMYIGQ